MTCTFCSVGVRAACATEPEDQVLAESQSFFVKPGLGHFSLGYSLICSRRHVGNMASLSLSELDELGTITEVFCARLRTITGKQIVVFEHGACSSNRGGACIDHAHLHLLPLPNEVAPELVLPITSRLIRSFRELQPLSGWNGAYLYCSTDLDMGRAYQLDRVLPSQYARRVYCERIGKPDEWDWAVFQYRDQIRNFIDQYLAEAELYRWESLIRSSEHASAEVI